VPGEICIGGTGLADGYFDRPNLTQERFISGPFESAEHTRLYRTGDRGRWRYDGALEHLGRIDAQVKVRGHRVELGEIESHLLRFPSIRRALVTTRESRSGDVRLIAYVVTNGTVPDAATLRTYLRERLPEYMLPQWFIPLDTIPTLPNGKTDLKRLPPPHQESSLTSATEPRTAIEKELRAIWRDILQISGVGIHDNFFDLGGHSILTVRLVSRIRIDLRRACTLPMVFRYPTVATLAAALESASALDGNSLIPLQPHGVDPPLFCICGVQIYQELANRLAPDIPVYGVFVPMEMEYVAPAANGAQPPPTVERLATEYLQTIRARQPHGPYRFLGFSFGGVLAFEMAQQLRAVGEDVTFLAILDSDVPDRRRRMRAGRIEQRLRTLKQSLGRRVKSGIRRIANGSAQLMTEARDEKYLAAMRTYAAARYCGPAIYIQAIDAVEYNPGYGWDALIPSLRSYRIPGDHLGILSAPNVDLLVAKLRPHMEK
jgi:thioesterase domain-containing protein